MIDMTLIMDSILIGYLYGSMSYLIPKPITVSGETGLMAGLNTTDLLCSEGIVLRVQFRFSLF